MDTVDDIQNEINEDVIVEAPIFDATILETAQELIASKEEPLSFSNKSILENDKISDQKVADTYEKNQTHSKINASEKSITKSEKNGPNPSQVKS